MQGASYNRIGRTEPVGNGNYEEESSRFFQSKIHVWINIYNNMAVIIRWNHCLLVQQKSGFKSEKLKLYHLLVQVQQARKQNPTEAPKFFFSFPLF